MSSVFVLKSPYLSLTKGHCEDIFTIEQLHMLDILVKKLVYTLLIFLSLFLTFSVHVKVDKKLEIFPGIES